MIFARKLLRFLILGLLVFPATTAPSQPGGPAATESQPAPRQPAPVMSYRGWQWLERDGRDEEERPYEVIAAMGLKDGDVVADIGCGSGYYARKMAKAVGPTGKVYGVDIQPPMLSIMQKLLEKGGITNVTPVLGGESDPKLPEASIDWMILADVYHEFQDPAPMLANMRDALKPDGRIALLEYRLNGTSAAHIKWEHRMSPEQVLAEWEPSGFELVELKESLPSQHLFIFKKSVAVEAAPEAESRPAENENGQEKKTEGSSPAQ